MQSDIQMFRSLLIQATSNIGTLYFQLPIATRERPIYRERVYCYELYHQLRVLWPSFSWYTLGGEVDKTGHPLFRDGPLCNVKPDILVHQPGDMSGNLVVLEVKPIRATTKGIEKDLITITEFVHLAEYKWGMYLVYGGSQKQIEDYRRRIQQIAIGENQARIDLEQIELYWHRMPNTEATKVNWQ